VHGCLRLNYLELPGSVLGLVKRKTLDVVLRPEERGIKNDVVLFGRIKDVKSLLSSLEAHDVVGLATLGHQEFSVCIAIRAVKNLDGLVIFDAGELEEGKCFS
jgi:hypothetical protein